jgi:hypothetical protein
MAHQDGGVSRVVHEAQLDQPVDGIRRLRLRRALLGQLPDELGAGVVPPVQQRQRAFLCCHKHASQRPRPRARMKSDRSALKVVGADVAAPPATQAAISACGAISL